MPKESIFNIKKGWHKARFYAAALPHCVIDCPAPNVLVKGKFCFTPDEMTERNRNKCGKDNATNGPDNQWEFAEDYALYETEIKRQNIII